MSDAHITELVEIFADWQWKTDIAEVYEEEALDIATERPEAAADHYLRASGLRAEADALLDTRVPLAPGSSKMIKARLLFSPELAELAAHAWFDRLIGYASQDKV